MEITSPAAALIPLARREVSPGAAFPWVFKEQTLETGARRHGTTASAHRTSWKGKGEKKKKISGLMLREHQGLIRLAEKIHSSLKAQIHLLQTLG